jgi:hypothetical protein
MCEAHAFFVLWRVERMRFEAGGMAPLHTQGIGICGIWTHRRRARLMSEATRSHFPAGGMGTR